VGEPGAPLSELDFVSDENPHKNTARLMYRMLGDINEEWLSQVEPEEGAPQVNMWCHTCHRGQPRPLKLEQKLSEMYAADGVDGALTGYQDLRERFYGGDTYSFREDALNALGYEILEAGHAADAVVVFRLNAEQFPESSNVWDSLGEAYAAAGDREQAIASFAKAVELEPRNRHAAEQLEGLRSGD
jgi:tetratricopeptide (TPR) repeat protein